LDPISITIAIILTIIGIATTWWFSRYYYLKGKPEQEFVKAFIESLKKERKEYNPDQVGDEKATRKWALALIEAFENNKIYVPELSIAAKAMRDAGEVITACFRQARQAADQSGMTLTPPWFSTYEKVLKEGLSKAKSDLLRSVGDSK
jgi:hypothetical protein